MALTASTANAFLSTTSRPQATSTTLSVAASIDLMQETDAIFDSIDINQDGTITREELCNHLTDTMGYAPDSAQCRYLFDAVDGDSSGEISKDELRAAFFQNDGSMTRLYTAFGMGGVRIENAPSFPDRVLETDGPLSLDDLADMAFDLIDVDRSGTIEPDELRQHVVAVTGDKKGTEAQTQEYVDTIFSVLDRNLDGVVNREEMRDAFQQHDSRFLYSTLGLPVYKKRNMM
ncbi:expressed unknown protein [Seminavis robusta]|uniref:EF-hand domain-containing protein n=1 Tax=Seminavis robusta TaxID=568900 RepID=A0A9N8DZP2_9STRA|nr:expressed unknown protein [Seminavis robusta]|eukprot:Sro419_g139180.1 n/a (232) ;mRNA; r:63646-64341